MAYLSQCTVRLRMKPQRTCLCRSFYPGGVRRSHVSRGGRVTTLAMFVFPTGALAELGPQPVSPAIWAASILSTVPFFVGLVVFARAIGRQRSCPRCKGSGLVATGTKVMVRCPECGGFLPWQHWWRFFSG
ncbi:hypothetical protein CCYA_CCYA17G4427 [Cyanidiococcus yangmingshanensis]|nr:hypothetical protein CCYA_CCYA17G4427 [Cyanidiococcus yangmingshanensis]